MNRRGFLGAIGAAFAAAVLKPAQWFLPGEQEEIPVSLGNGSPMLLDYGDISGVTVWSKALTTWEVVELGAGLPLVAAMGTARAIALDEDRVFMGAMTEAAL